MSQNGGPLSVNYGKFGKIYTKKSKHNVKMSIAFESSRKKAAEKAQLKEARAIVLEKV